MRSLPRHVLVHSDGRRLLVYGELRGSLEEEGPGAAGDGAEIHKRLDVFTEAWVGIAPARNTRPLDSPAKSAGLERCPFCPGGIEVPFSYDAAVFDNRFPSFRPDPPPAPLLRRPDRTGAGALRGRSLHRPTRRLVRRAVADRARPRRRDLDRPRTRALGGSRARIRLRLREPGRRGRSHHRAPARADLRARSRPAGHGGKVRGPPPPPPTRGTLPLVRGDASRRPLRPRRLRERELRRGRPLRGEVALRGGGPGAPARATALGRPRPRGAARPRRRPARRRAPVRRALRLPAAVHDGRAGGAAR